MGILILPTLSALCYRAEQILKCIAQDCTHNHTNWDTFQQDQQACFTAVKVWWPQPHRTDTTLGKLATLVTQLSADRLDQVKSQCRTWTGPLTAAVYLPLLNPEPQLSKRSSKKIATVTAQLDDLFLTLQARRTAAVKPAFPSEDGTAAFWSNLTTRASEGNSKGAKSQQLLQAAKQLTPATINPAQELWRGCQLRLVLVYELISEERAMALYPINSMRNFARLLADTPLIANIDVDMLPSLSLSASLAPGRMKSGRGGVSSWSEAGAALLKGVEEQRSVYVIPAFETQCGGPLFADAIAMSNKDSLQRIDGGACFGSFRSRAAASSHLPTHFDAWHHGDGNPYPVTYAPDFEPWFISSRTTSLWHDVRFRGYGKNKIVQVAGMNESGVSFWVHGTGFLVHRTHSESRSRRQFLRTKYSKTALEEAGGTIFGHVEALWNASQLEIRRKGYVPHVEDVVKSCLAELPWWQ